MLSLTKTVALLSCAAGLALSFTGDITYYEPGLGACGETSTDSEHVVALSPAQFAQDPNVCGKTIQISSGSGVTTTARVVDKCPGCSADSIDVSSTVFQLIAPLTVGRTQVEWDFIS